MSPRGQPYSHGHKSFAQQQSGLERDRKTNSASGPFPSQAQDNQQTPHLGKQTSPAKNRCPNRHLVQHQNQLQDEELPSAQPDSGVDWRQVELPFYAELFRPRWPRNLQALPTEVFNPQAGGALSFGGDWAVGWCENDPVPCAESAEHASQILKALNDFHVAVTLAGDTHDTENRNALLTKTDDQTERYMQKLREIVDQAMSTFRKLNVRSDQVVFFYHGRGDITLGNLLWEMMSEGQHDMQIGCDNEVMDAGQDRQPAQRSRNESIPKSKGATLKTAEVQRNHGTGRFGQQSERMMTDSSTQ